MWIGKFKINHECPILEKTRKYNVISSGYVLNMYEEKGEKYHSILHVVKGSEKDKKKFMNSFKNDKNIASWEIDGDQLYLLIKGEMIAQRYSKKLMFLEPIVHQKNTETWTLGCQNRDEIIKFYKGVKEIGTIEILQLKKIKSPLLIQSIVPQLTIKQRDALEHAVLFGYYDSPRKISVKDLALKLKTPRATLQEHLRKAESKILKKFTFFYRNIS